MLHDDAGSSFCGFFFAPGKKSSGTLGGEREKEVEATNSGANSCNSNRPHHSRPTTVQIDSSRGTRTVFAGSMSDVIQICFTEREESCTCRSSSSIYPQFDPIINGLQHNGVQHNYALGDFVVANCSSDMSSPPARLYWFINDRNVPSDYLQPPHETTVENDGFLLRYRTLEIRFYIDEKRLGKLKGKLALKCLARIDSIPQATRESTQIIYIPTTDELRNQKLINWRGSDASTVHWSVAPLCLVQLVAVLRACCAGRSVGLL
ncbi:AGAP000937-PA-like protein [Anopheles sinensis]|uniref:AGAP000937-PA-like protein n=1 Tax=Anopheles sinensis TaxID=74873 RepID=A0A084VIT1_ANOSI|nr:AGAP000937-PA-like protein [Anopheles sinensis]